MLTVLPALALVMAVLVDRGADGELRVSLFPVALLAFDPFAWTCVRNSLIFATAVTSLSLIVGVGIGWALSGHHHRGGRLVRAAVSSLLAASPACLALGWLGILGTHGRWPIALKEAASGGLSLESWRGWPAWLLWIWASAPAAIALVAIATAAVRERIEPAWRDAARLAGAGPFRTWRSVSWPLIRPAAARAAAIVFPLALLEPGAPLILGLRRTIAFQIVDAAARTDPFPRTAVWTVMAAAFSLTGRRILRWWGGPPLVEVSGPSYESARLARRSPRAGAPLAMASGLLLVVFVALAWLPVLGLVQMLAAAGTAVSDPTGSRNWSLTEVVQRAVAPPVPQVVFRSLILGIEAGAIVVLVARLLRPDPGTRLVTTLSSRLVGRIALMPPLAQGVGLLAMLDLASQFLRSSVHLVGLTGPLARIDELAPELAVERNPWPILTAAVGLSVGQRLLQSWRRAAERRAEESRSGLGAAVLAGSSVTRARAVASLRPGRWIGGFLLVLSLSAVNLAPALLFSPWMDGRPLAPAMLVLAERPDNSRLQAAALACCVIAGNLAGLRVSRMASAPPPEWNPDPP